MAALKTDPTTEEDCGGVATSEESTSTPSAATAAKSESLSKIKGATGFEKEFAFFGKEQTEPGEIDLLFVDFDLCEVGVVGEIRGEILGDPVFQVNASVPV